MTKEKPDHRLIFWSWALTILFVALMFLNFVGWALGVISHEAVDVITNVLSWLAMVATFGGIIVTSYTKRAVNE